MTWKLYLDDKRFPLQGEWIIARSMDDAIYYVFNRGLPEFISFDHDLGLLSGSGMDFAKWLCGHIQTFKIPKPEGFGFAVHSANPVGAENIRSYMTQFLEHWDELVQS